MRGALFNTKEKTWIYKKRSGWHGHLPGLQMPHKEGFLGNSKLEIKEKAPEWLEKAKRVISDIKAGQLPQV